MARFVMANRHAGRSSRAAKLASRDALSSILSGSFMTGSSVLSQNEPADDTARHSVVFEADPAEVRAKASGLPDEVLVEPEIRHHHGPFGRSPVPAAETEVAAADEGPVADLPVSVRSETGGAALSRAQVALFFQGYGFRRKVSAMTGSDGDVMLQYDGRLEPAAVTAMPHDEFWPMVATDPSAGTNVACPALPSPEDHQGWWHQRLGLTTFRADRGRGIRVGVIDTGAGPNPALDHVKDAGCFSDGAGHTADGRDVESHGTHICGIIGARPTRASDFGGVAPGAELFSARVFDEQGAATQLGVAHALDALAGDHEVDLVNLSLGSDRGSRIEHDAIVHALERGMLCICAAGNTSGDVMFPGAFPETVAVTALGLTGWGPAGSVPAMRKPRDADCLGDDGLFLDLLSCHGSAVAACAPGVGIISTVPQRAGVANPFTAMGGSSMAAAVACGALALLLSVSKEYAAMPRNRGRAEAARRLLERSCRDVGLRPEFQGRGLPGV